MDTDVACAELQVNYSTYSIKDGQSVAIFWLLCEPAQLTIDDDRHPTIRFRWCNNSAVAAYTRMNQLSKQWLMDGKLTPYWTYCMRTGAIITTHQWVSKTKEIDTTENRTPSARITSATTAAITAKLSWSDNTKPKSVYYMPGRWPDLKWQLFGGGTGGWASLQSLSHVAHIFGFSKKDVRHFFYRFHPRSANLLIYRSHSKSIIANRSHRYLVGCLLVWTRHLWTVLHTVVLTVCHCTIESSTICRSRPELGTACWHENLTV